MASAQARRTFAGGLDVDFEDLCRDIARAETAERYYAMLDEQKLAARLN